VPCYEHDGATFNPHTDPESHSAQRHRQTDRQTNGRTSLSVQVANHTACSSTIGSLIQKSNETATLFYIFIVHFIVHSHSKHTNLLHIHRS